MYGNYIYACRFKSYELLLSCVTRGVAIFRNPQILDRVTTTNAVRNEKFINQNDFLYKILLSPKRYKSYLSKLNLIKSICFREMVPPVSGKDRFEKKNLQIYLIFRGGWGS